MIVICQLYINKAGEKTNRKINILGYSSVVKHILNIHKALHSILHTTKKKKRRRRRRRKSK
jgi:hypothetical protein